MIPHLDKDQYLVYFPRENTVEIICRNGMVKYSTLHFEEFLDLIPEVGYLLKDLSPNKVYILDWEEKTVKEAPEITRIDVINFKVTFVKRYNELTIKHSAKEYDFYHAMDVFNDQLTLD